MDHASWHQAAELFLAALELAQEERAPWLERTCQDQDLREEVLALLAAHQADGGLVIEERLLGAASGDPATASLPAGTMLGHYRIEAPVGEGGMGEVYRAQRVDGEYRQTVAVKLLRPGLLAAETVRRFRTERQVLARLIHPDIVPILDGGTAPDGRPYLVLQFVEGEPITDYCERRRLDLDSRLRLFQRIAEAVQFAHGHLVVHRDIKPSNIMVEPDGAPRLLDFGIAKLLDRELADSPFAVTRPELRMLTPEHAAPEQLRGEAIGTATDVYGLGVLLFELLTGRRPFPSSGRTTSELAEAILNEPPPAPSMVTDGGVESRRLRGDLDRIVLMALRKDPGRRYRSAGEFAEDVERYLGGLPVRAQRDTIPYRVRKFIGRNRGAVAGAALLAVLVAGFVATTVSQSRTVARERDRAERERAAAEDVVAVLTSLFERTNPMLVPGGDTLRTGALIDEAERRVDRLEGQPTRRIRLARALGRLRTARGEYARARALTERAWAEIGGEPGASDLERAGLYHELAMAVLVTEGAESARPMLDTSLARHLELLAPGHPDLATVLGDRASAEPDPAARQALLVRARRILESADTALGVALAGQFNEEGSARFSEGRLDEALARFEAAGDLLAQEQPPEHPNRLTVGRNVAAVLTELGRWAEAESLLSDIQARESISIGPAPRSATLEMLGLVLANQGRLEQAERLLRRSLAISRDSAQARKANTYRNLGVLLAMRGSPEAGLPLLDSAIATERARQGDDGVDLAYMMGQRGLLLLAVGRTRDGAAAVRRGWSGVRAGLPEATPRRVDAESWMGIVALQAGDAEAARTHFAAGAVSARLALPRSHPRAAMTRCGLAVALVRLGQWEAAREDLQESCRIYSGWGLAHPLLAAAARQAAATVNVQFR